jgi:hypothetical protein
VKTEVFIEISDKFIIIIYRYRSGSASENRGYGTKG